MKLRVFRIFTILTLVFVALGPHAWGQGSLTELEKVSGGTLRRWVDDDSGTVVMLYGKQLSAASPTPASQEADLRSALDFLAKNRRLIKLENPRQELVLTDYQSDKDGTRHLRLDQYFQGIPVLNQQLLVHIRRDGAVETVNGRYLPSPTGMQKSRGEISETQAVKAAMQAFSPRLRGGAATIMLGKPRIVITLPPGGGPPMRAWIVRLALGFTKCDDMLVDAGTGKIIRRLTLIHTEASTPTGRGQDLQSQEREFPVMVGDDDYYMVDTTLPMYKGVGSDGDRVGTAEVYRYKSMEWRNNSPYRLHWALFSSPDNIWTDPTSVSAHCNAVSVYKYYLTRFNRNSFDDKGMSIYSVVHVLSGIDDQRNSDQPWDNACWHGGFNAMFYGDGSELFHNLAGAMDVIGHEMTHGVVDFTADLEPGFQCGALNESFADVMGNMIKNSLCGTTDNWLIGDGAVIGRRCLRDMADPHQGLSQTDPGWQPATMDEYQELSEDDDGGGVHVNAGIPNHAAYLVANAIGREKTEQIYYLTLRAYLPKRAQFLDARLCLERAAAQLYGADGIEEQAVRNAFDAVGIRGTEEEIPHDPPTGPAPAPGRVYTSVPPVWSIAVPQSGRATVRDNEILLETPGYILDMAGVSVPRGCELVRLVRAFEGAAPHGPAVQPWSHADMGGRPGLFRICIEVVNNRKFGVVEAVFIVDTVGFVCKFYTLPERGMLQTILDRVLTLQLATVQCLTASLEKLKVPRLRGGSLPRVQWLHLPIPRLKARLQKPGA